MAKKTSPTASGTSAGNAFAKKALESIAQIDEETKQRKAEQLESLREALKAIDGRMRELEAQRQQVQDVIDTISGKRTVAPRDRKPRLNLDGVQERVVRWLVSHAGQTYGASDLQREFLELEGLPSIAAFLKGPIAEGVVAMDQSGGRRNTKYTALAR